MTGKSRNIRLGTGRRQESAAPDRCYYSESHLISVVVAIEHALFPLNASQLYVIYQHCGVGTKYETWYLGWHGAR